MNKKIIENLALIRVEAIKQNDERQYRKIDSVLCQIYDIAIDNFNTLPDKFFISKVSLSEEDFISVFSKLGFDVDVKIVNSGDQYGDMYQVKLK